jgi:hypothetical protein
MWRNFPISEHRIPITAAPEHVGRSLAIWPGCSLTDRHTGADDAEYLHDARPRAQHMIILLDPGRLLNRLVAGLNLVLPRTMTAALMAAKCGGDGIGRD